MADASSLTVTEPSAERAAKRQRTDDPAEPQSFANGEASVVGEGQHDAPTNGNSPNGRKDDRDSDKVRSIAPIKKE
jgi:hypothetical protein